MFPSLCGVTLWFGAHDKCICYNAASMSECLLKAKKFYFEKFLPSLAPYMIIKNSQHAINKIARDSRDTTTAQDTTTARDTAKARYTESDQI